MHLTWKTRYYEAYKLKHISKIYRNTANWPNSVYASSAAMLRLLLAFIDRLLLRFIDCKSILTGKYMRKLFKYAPLHLQDDQSSPKGLACVKAGFAEIIRTDRTSEG